jgi:hypothetical protein
MSTTYLGSLTVGGVLPGGVALGAAGVAGINAALPSLLEQLEGLLSFAPTPISLTAQISTLEAMITGLNAAITLGVMPPSLDTQIAGIAALIAALSSVVGGINAQLALITSFQAALGAAGVHAIAFEGPVANLGVELTGRLAAVPGLSPGDAAHALTLLTTVPATWAALAQLMKVTP